MTRAFARLAAALSLSLAAWLPAWAASGGEILAIGDSLTRGRGLEPEAAYPARLEALLRAQGRDVTVRNLGVDGERTTAAYQRLVQGELPDHTRLVIFQQSGNDAAANDAGAAIEASGKALAWLHEHHVPALFISSRRIMSDEAARALAETHGAAYHGPFYRGIPRDDVHVQPGEFFARKQATDFHLTAEGCAVLAGLLAPEVAGLLDHPGP